MIIILIILIIYILSIVSCRWVFRLCSSKHYNLWCDEDCGFNLIWIIPIINTIMFMVIGLHISVESKFKLPKSKLLNTDLIDDK